MPENPTVTWEQTTPYSRKIISLTEKTCSEENENEVDSQDGLSFTQCKEEASKLHDVNYIWFAEPFGENKESICSLYRNCEDKRLINGRMPRRPGGTYQKKYRHHP